MIQDLVRCCSAQSEPCDCPVSSANDDFCPFMVNASGYSCFSGSSLVLAI
jgi:hypothetical protein